MAPEIPEAQPASMAPVARDPSTGRAEPLPEAASNERLAASSPEALASALAEPVTLAPNSAEPLAGEVSLAQYSAPPVADQPETPSHQSIPDVNASQSDPNWSSIGDIVPPLAMSEIGDDDNYQSGVEGSLPSAVFVIPFPAPVNSHRGKNTPPFLMYSPPRSVYQRPPKTEDGKRPKEKIVKKVVRKWQEEVVMGEKIKRGELTNPGRFNKIRGGCIRVASSINKWLPNSCIETLGRLPPKRKLGGVTIIHPSFSGTVEEAAAEDRDRPYEPTPDELLNDIGVLLRKTRKRVLTRAILSGMLLPISLGIDVFAPVFAFEINMTYFAFQIYGLKKCNALTVSPKKQRAKRFRKERQSTTEEATLLVGNSPAQVPYDGPQTGNSEEIFQVKPIAQHALDPVMLLLYNICAKIDPISFPPLASSGGQGTNLDSPPSSQASTLPPSLKKPGGAVVKEMIEAFRETLPPDVTQRYLLDEDRMSEDLARYLKKASKEYIDSLSGRGNRKGFIHRVKTWKQKSAGKKEQKAEKSRQKKEEKREKKNQNRRPSASLRRAPRPFSPIPSPLGLSTMASASRALFSRASPLHAAASRFLRPLAAAGSLLVLPVALVLSPAAVRRFATQPTNLSRTAAQQVAEWKTKASAIPQSNGGIHADRRRRGYGPRPTLRSDTIRYTHRCSPAPGPEAAARSGAATLPPAGSWCTTLGWLLLARQLEPLQQQRDALPLESID